MACPVFDSSHILGRKWSVMVFEEIAMNRFKGFNQFLKKSRNITPKVLSMQLKELEGAKLIRKKTVVSGGRNITQYNLTEKGQEFHRLIVDLKEWNIKWNSVPKACLNTSC